MKTPGAGGHKEIVMTLTVVDLDDDEGARSKREAVRAWVETQRIEIRRVGAQRVEYLHLATIVIADEV